jgi:integrase
VHAPPHLHFDHLELRSHAVPTSILSKPNATRRQSENDELLSRITIETIRAGRERRSAAPHAANNFLKSMRRFFNWVADPEGGNLIATNPTIGVKLLKGKNDKEGFHTWTEEEIQRFENRWPIGTRERLAPDLLPYTGLARGDVVRLGRQHVTNGVIDVADGKESRGRDGLSSRTTCAR